MKRSLQLSTATDARKTAGRYRIWELIPRNVIAKYLGAEQFEHLDKQKESRLRSGVRADQTTIRLGDDRSSSPVLTT